jgi:hypothetical protein
MVSGAIFMQYLKLIAVALTLAYVASGCGGSRIHYGGQTECDAAFAAQEAKAQTLKIGVTAESEAITTMGSTGAPYTQGDGSIIHTYDVYGTPGDTGSYCGQWQFTARNAVVTVVTEFRGYRS